MNKIEEIIKLAQSKLNDSKLKTNDINTIVYEIYQKLIEKNIPYMLVRDVIYNMLECTYNIIETKDINFRQWDKLLKIDEINNSDIKIPKKYMKTFEQFMTLYNTPQPEQRTKEWFDYRYNRITASDTATAIDMNPYESVESFICKKCDPNFPFLDNDFVFHGKKYEQIATSLYEHLYNTKVTEFGCVPSEKHKFLGASPDGISSKSTLDYKFNPKLGTMLEIKCPYVREIKNKGEIAGEICPYYYYCQVQQQLECCDLDNCDFIQCNLQEYTDREEFLKDVEHKFIITEGIDGKEITVDNNMSKGYLLQFLPKIYEPTFDGDKHIYKGFFIYPPKLTMNLSQYDEWVLSTLNTWKKDYPEKADTYYFDKILYWKIKNAHTVTIPRDREWFAKVFPVLKETWNKVSYYREHLEELPLVQDLADKRKKFYRYKTDFKVNNIDNKLFLQDEPVKKVYTKSKYTTYKKKTYIAKQENDCDFIDD